MGGEAKIVFNLKYDRWALRFVLYSNGIAETCSPLLITALTVE